MALLAALLLLGCQPKARLMPAPAVYTSGEHSPFDGAHTAGGTNRVPLFYATNRAPIGPRQARSYTIIPAQSLYLGEAVIRIGPYDKPWDALHALSTGGGTERRPSLTLDTIDEIAALPAKQELGRITPEVQAFLDQIDAALAASPDHDLTIYVHGSNSSVELAAAQAAQLRHFTGRRAVVLVFIWPSAGSALRYLTDVANARQSVPAFTRLLRLLAGHTRARAINVLAYSAGAQIISPGLAELGVRPFQRDTGESRLGEIYLAAPDIGLPSFIKQLPRYLGAARRITVSANLQDAALGLSRWIHGISRLGRPNPAELSDTDTRWLIDASERLSFDLISVKPDVIPSLRKGSHAFWYDNPWVSSDVLIKLQYHLPPGTRGLVPQRASWGGRYWTFPADYEQRAAALMRTLNGNEPARPRSSEDR